MAKLVTNQREFLTEIIEKILPSTNNLHFLVGFFYFSGFEQIYRSIGDKKIRILIGMSIEKSLLNRIKEFHIVQEVNQSRLEIKKDFFTSLVSVFNDTDYFDTEERQEAFRFFLKKVKDGSLEIRKTEHPNHAKMYLFESSEEHSKGGLFPGTMITGSSNLTFSGMTGQHELNVILTDEYVEGKRIFDDLWDNHSVEIVSPVSIEDFVKNVEEKIWVDRLYYPFLFYIRVLLEYFEIEQTEEIVYPYQITKGQFLNLKYQKDAIRKAITVLDRHNGVLVCDVVGLGKSIIASAIAYNLRKKVIIIAPPHLRYQWDSEYRTHFNLNAVVFGSGSIEKALEQQQLWKDEELLIIVDEAHKYRNEITKDYLNLHRLCQGNKVVLLTATPFNNRPQDIFSMLKLFQIPSRSTIRTVDNLSSHFQELIKEHRSIEKERRDADPNDKDTALRIKLQLQDIAKRIRNIMEPIVIRRSRIDLEKITEYRKDLKKQKISYSIVEPPIRKEYYLGSQSQLYLNTLYTIEKDNKITDDRMPDNTPQLIGTRYNPLNYIIDNKSFLSRLKKEYPHIDPESLQTAQINLAKLMKKLLVARFESSVYAFQKTLESMLSSMENMKNYYLKINRVPVFKRGALPEIDMLLKNVDEETLNAIDEYCFETELAKFYEKDLFFINKEELNDNYLPDLDNDIDLLRKIHNEWFGKGFPQDPKLESLIKDIKRQLAAEPQRKIVLFSEYADTVSYLFDKIIEDGSVRVISHFSGLGEKNLKTIRRNFDASHPNQQNDYDLLIATDALSEGVNLNRAGTVFNYDIPYNPTRVIQRVGRINRIGKKLFDKLFIYNYFPTDIGEDEIRKKQISTLKKAMIDALLGEDTKVLTDEEELNSYFNEKFYDALVQDEQESWDAQYQEELYYIKQQHPELVELARLIPHRSRIRRKSRPANLVNSIPVYPSSVLIFGKKSDEFTFRLGISPDESLPLAPDEALALFKAQPDEKPHQVSPNFEAIYQNAKKNLVKTKLSVSGITTQTINKIEYLKDNCPAKRDYFQDLYTVAKDLRNLPEYAEKFIRSIDLTNSTLPNRIEELEAMIPHDYLAKIITTARKIADGKETLILSEEFTLNREP